MGGNNLSAKNLNEKKFLKRVPGMALTQAQKKKLLKKQQRENTKKLQESAVEWEDAEILSESSDPAEEQKKEDELNISAEVSDIE